MFLSSELNHWFFQIYLMAVIFTKMFFQLFKFLSLFNFIAYAYIICFTFDFGQLMMTGIIESWKYITLSFHRFLQTFIQIYVFFLGKEMNFFFSHCVQLEYVIKLLLFDLIIIICFLAFFFLQVLLFPFSSLLM